MVTPTVNTQGVTTSMGGRGRGKNPPPECLERARPLQDGEHGSRLFPSPVVCGTRRSLRKLIPGCK